jgi:hypothetical protein
MTLDNNTRTDICEHVKAGMPLRKVAHLMKMTRKRIDEEMMADPGFRGAVLHARAQCMNELLKKLNGAKQWQAATFLLESLWPRRFGRNRKGGPSKDRQTQLIDSADLSPLTDEEQKQLEFLLAKLDAPQTKTPEETVREQGAGREASD